MNTQENKTPEQWFQQLKEPYRSEAIKGIDKSVMGYVDYPKSLEDALMFCIFWEATRCFPDVKPTRDDWDVIYRSIQAGETTYLEIDNTDNLKPEPIDWKAKFEQLQKKYDELLSKQNNQGEKIYFCFSGSTNKFLFYENLNKALETSDEGFQIYEAVCIGKKKSVLVNE